MPHLLLTQESREFPRFHNMLQSFQREYPIGAIPGHTGECIGSIPNADFDVSENELNDGEFVKVLKYSFFSMLPQTLKKGLATVCLSCVRISIAPS